MKNPLSDTQWSKLKASLEWSDRQLEFTKRKRIQAIRDFAGYHYAEGGAQKRVPVPMLALAVSIYIRQLAAQAPRVLITTKRPELKPTAANLELALNQIPEEIGLSATLRRMVMEALFSIGVVKVGLHKVGTSLGHDYGEPFVDVVTIDDYFCDMAAKVESNIDYEGNVYWMDYDEVKEAKWLDKKERDDLKPDEYTVVGPAGEQRAEGVGADSSADQYRDRVWLRDVWLPRDGLLLTMGNQTKTLLKVVEWNGPGLGPYHKLGFADVPGNLLPLPPVSLWRDLHELSNTLFRKLGNQAESQKNVQGFSGGDDESVANFKNASDGEGIRFTGSEPKKLSAGGVDPNTLAFYLQCRDLFSYFAGNLDSLGGLSNRASTLGQDKMLGEAASSQMRDMADRTVDTIRGIFRTLAFYEWHDPIKRRLLEKPIPGTAVSIPVEWNKKSRKGEFNMYDLDIDVYSLQDNSPGARLQKLGVIMQQYVLPLAPMIQQAGGTIDVQSIFKMVGKYADLPELDDIVSFGETDMQGVSGQQPLGMPANTTRTYERTGGPGMSQQGADATMMQQLIAQGGQGGK